MGWIISQALYEKWHSSQGLVEESSEGICSDGKQSAPLNGSHTQLVYLWPDKMTAFSRLSRFGMMCRPLTENRGEDLLMWYREDFLARTYPQQEREQALPESVAVCGRTWHALSEKYDLNSCSWKIHHSLFPVELDWSSVILPRWGMTVSGQLYQHQTSERPISATGSGLWPTPRSCSAMAATITPESAWNKDRMPNLETIVGRRTWPTPCASDNKGQGQSWFGSDPAEKREGETDHAFAERVGHIWGIESPWVEWLMGWPLGWTDLRPLAMDKFQSWQQQHLISCETDNA
jgi:hypothetical protein